MTRHALRSLLWTGLALGLLALTLVSVGCTPATRSRGPTVDCVAAYFRDVEIGRPVHQIEADLGLPAPAERQAPAFGWPGWKYRYVAGEVVILFYGELDETRGGDEGPHHTGTFVYTGNLYVQTVEEYWEGLREKELRAAAERELTVESLEAYFNGVEIGRPVHRIEADLNLPPPTATEAPSRSSPGWKLRYSVNGLSIYFRAELDETRDYNEGPAHTGTFVYTGYAHVWSEQEYPTEDDYWRALREKAFEE